MKSLPQRKSPRLKSYDYSQSGAYFITICSMNRQHLFGEIENGLMSLSELGELVRDHWEDLPKHFPMIELDAFVVMPNHLHGILLITDVGTQSIASETKTNKTPKLGTIVATYKAAVSRQVNRLSIVEGHFWQGRYHDHIIRSEKTLNIIRQYVATNPERWEDDTFYSGTS
jgi:putative transposase